MPGNVGVVRQANAIQRDRPAEVADEQEDLMTAIYIYWISTALLSLLYLASASMYAAKTARVRQTLADLYYPAPYLRFSA